MEAFLGALEFQENEYEELKELYESLKTKQKPHTLFISCVDSRVVPNLITGNKPGELYVIRNMGNVIPPKTSYRESLSTIASIEYAIAHVGVHNLIICGHSDCGACGSIHLINDETTKAKTPLHCRLDTIFRAYQRRVKKPSAIQQPFRQAFMAYRAFECVLATQQPLKL